MESRELNEVQITTLVGRLLSERRVDELANLARQDGRVLDQLVSALRGGEGPLCMFAAAALSKAGEAAVRPLLEASQHQQQVVRQMAASALGDTGDLVAVETLIGCLGDRSDVVRQSAAVSLGKLGASEAVDPLVGLLTDQSEIVRRAAVNALGMIGDVRALPELERIEAEETEAVGERARGAIRQIRE